MLHKYVSYMKRIEKDFWWSLPSPFPTNIHCVFTTLHPISYYCTVSSLTLFFALFIFLFYWHRGFKFFVSPCGVLVSWSGIDMIERSPWSKNLISKSLIPIPYPGPWFWSLPILILLQTFGNLCISWSNTFLSDWSDNKTIWCHGDTRHFDSQVPQHTCFWKWVGLPATK